MANKEVAKIVIDRDLCIGAVSCTIVAPKVFAMDDENKAILLDPKGNDSQTIIESAQSCPTAAIILFDDQGNQIYP